MKISIVGSGNVATQLGKALKNCGHEIVFVYSRNFKHASKLGVQLNSSFGKDINELAKFSADVCIIAVKDDAIKEVVNKMPRLTKELVIHTSGATDISVLKKKFKNCGVLWQIQTIEAKSKSDYKKIPIVIEASNATAGKKLKQLAKELSSHVYVLDSTQRRVLHLGAVFVNNFPNHLFYLAEKFLKEHKLPFNLYHPLILSTIESAMHNAKESQTGPARRNDKVTMKEHLKLLPDKNYKAIYKLLSISITELYKS